MDFCRRFACVVASLAVAQSLVSGCASKSSSAKPATPVEQDTQNDDRVDPAASATKSAKNAKPAKDYSDSLVISEMRERAIAGIESASFSGDAEVRTNAMEAAAEAPSRFEAVIASGLKDGNAAVRTTAAMTVGKVRLKKLSPAVISVAGDESNYVKAAAIYALERCGEQIDPTPLATILLSDPSTKVRSHVAFILGELGNPSAKGLLRQAAKANLQRATEQDIKLMQLQFAEALVKLGEENSVQAIRAAMYPSRPEDLEATALAVQIIGTIKDRGAIDQLIYLAAQKDAKGQPMVAEVRLAVAGSLAKMGMREGSFIVEEYWQNPNPAIRAQCAYVYGQIGGPSALGRLDQLLSDTDPRVQVFAAYGILHALAGR